MLWHVLQEEAVQGAINFSMYLSQCIPCICLIVLILRSSESLIFINTYIKFHFNPMISSWGAIFNVPECISKIKLIVSPSLKSEKCAVVFLKKVTARFPFCYLFYSVLFYFLFIFLATKSIWPA